MLGEGGDVDEDPAAAQAISSGTGQLRMQDTTYCQGRLWTLVRNYPHEVDSIYRVLLCTFHPITCTCISTQHGPSNFEVTVGGDGNPMN